jgi:hypothetical protein
MGAASIVIVRLLGKLGGMLGRGSLREVQMWVALPRSSI